MATHWTYKTLTAAVPLLLTLAAWPAVVSAAAPVPILVRDRLPPSTPSLRVTTLPSSNPARQVRAVSRVLAFAPQARPTDKLDPLFCLEGTDPTFKATLWLQQTPVGLHLAVDVRDPVHSNAQSGSHLWDGDAIQLALHPLVAGENKDAWPGEQVGPNDLFVSLALLTTGPAGWAHWAGEPADVGAWRHPLTVDRRADAGVTRYRVVVPWSVLNTQPGGLPALGLSAWVLDGGLPAAAAQSSGAPASPPRRLRLGASAAGGVRPADMVRVQLAPPDGAFAAFGPARAYVADGREGMATTLITGSLAAAAPLQLRWLCGERLLAQLAWTGTGTGTGTETATGTGTATRQILALPDERRCAANAPLRLQLRQADGTVVAERQRTSTTLPQRLQAAERALQRALAAAASLPAAGATDSLAYAEILAVRGLIATLAAERDARGPIDNFGGSAALGRVADAVAKAFACPANRRARQATGATGYVLATHSAEDGSLQPYRLTPPQRPRSIPAPLVVWLHGRGNPDVADFLADALAPAAGDKRNEVDGAFPLADAWQIAPWARGNHGAVGLGQSDVMAALAAVQDQLAIDTNRIYLGGHSLGGTAAFALALHQPEPWAAVAIVAGGSWWTSLGHGLGRNVAHLPFFFWHGLADGAVAPKETRRMLGELESNGVACQATFAEGMGHVLPANVWQDVHQFFAGHRRAQPNHWRYTADGFNHRRHRAISLAVDAAKDPYPWVDVQLDPKGTLVLRSAGTDGLEVDLAALFGGSAASTSTPVDANIAALQVQVLYQGRAVYRGPAGQLRLGTGAARP